MLAIVSLFSACEQSEEIAALQNSFQYEGNEYILDDGMVVRGQTTSPHQFDFMVYSGFQINPTNSGDEIASITGTGHAIEVPLIYSPEPNELAPGIYTFNKLTPREFTFSAGYLALDYTNETADGKIAFFTAGKLEVKRIGEDYELIFEFTDEGNKSVSGYYKGSIDFKKLRYTSEKSASLATQANPCFLSQENNESGRPV